MKRKSAWLSFAACALTAVTTLTPLQAEPPAGAAAKPNFSEVQMIPFAGGKIGFFDKNTGTLYIYDSHLSICQSVYKITQLGEHIELLKGVGVDLGLK